MTKTQRQYDAVVIGSGPGGEGAAMQLAKNGRKVLMIEKHQSIGGGCTHWGTIPSKALRHSVSRLIEYNTNPLFSGERVQRGLTFAEILKHAQGVIRKQVQLRSGFYQRNGVDVVHGTASFVNAHELQIKQADGTLEFVTTEQVVIASGSRPYHPKDVDFTHERIYDSDTVLDLKHEPKSIIIYGAGVVGCEYASIFRGLGVKVDLVNTRDRLLSFLDAEISDALSYHLRNSGVVIRHNEEYASIKGTDDGVVLMTESGKRIVADCLLFANGRSGNIEDLAVEKVGL
ncbi:NAD(P)(+) transhydrogenase, partial [Pseudidiomarina aestuarii]